MGSRRSLDGGLLAASAEAEAEPFSPLALALAVFLPLSFGVVEEGSSTESINLSSNRS